MRTPIWILAIAIPATAAAQRRHDGFVAQLHLGLGWCTDDSCDEENPMDAELGTGASFGAFLGYRFPFPYLSVGGNFQFSFHPVDDEERFADDASAHSLAFDFGARGHPIAEGPIDPWIGIGVGYASIRASWSNNTANDRDESTSATGPALVFSLGGDYWLSDQLAVGLAFRYLLGFWSEVCVDTEASELIYGNDICVSPEDWEDRDNAFFNFDESDLPDLVQFLLTGTFAPG